MNTVRISRTNDPFKKYWWVILVAFGVVGAWICMPGVDAQTSGGGAGGERGLRGEQSLDSAKNPAGAPGSAVDLSMDGAGPYRKHEGPITSSLYQAPEEVAASSAASSSAGAGGSLANALKDIARKSATRSASADASGWGGEKAQKGFAAPKANFQALSGGGGGGGSSGASFSAGGGEGGLSAFGTGKANTGVSFAKGLGGGASDEGLMKNATASMKRLNGAANGAIAAAGQKSNDLASAMGGRSFDGTSFSAGGRGAGSGVGDGGGGGVALGGAGYGRLDSAPRNLKANDPKIDQKTITPPPVVPPDTKPNMQQMMMQMMMMGLIGAVMQGLVGAIL
ncbi:MAG: hypothetical protein HY077_03345 [Elusimicrobia bacterium]|nr:hypothetical protein [Elusimicrobiota bacterium]